MTIVLDKIQQKAVDLALSEKVLVITGSPGTGKTSILLKILEKLESRGLNTKCAAPTGKAAKRMEEQTGREASTIHRLLGFSPEGGYKHDDSFKLDLDVLCCDEWSMTNIELSDYVTRALPGHAKLVILGDKNQLPAIGPGNVLADMIKSGSIPVVELKKIYRQSENSWICTNAQLINQGKMVKLEDCSEDFFFYEEETPQSTADKIVDLVTEEIPRKYDLDPFRDIQVLCPQKKGPIGVNELNNRLQEKLNPKWKHNDEWIEGFNIFRQNEKVIHCRNNYQLGVFNGEVGVIDELDSKGWMGGEVGWDLATSLKDVFENKNEQRYYLSVEYPDKTVSYPKNAISQLMMSYAITIHRGQGSEWPCMVMPVHSTNSFMLSRPLLYTAVTRAESLCFLVGNMKGLKHAIRKNEVTKRHTSLERRLKGLKMKEAVKDLEEDQLSW
jgi:exodeoxyribonuclease V alpha subunit